MGVTLFTVHISIHAPLTGGDETVKKIITKAYEFQSTPPSREATPNQSFRHRETRISIHAPLTGGDSLPLILLRQ